MENLIVVWVKLQDKAAGSKDWFMFDIGDKTIFKGCWYEYPICCIGEASRQGHRGRGGVYI